MRSYLVSVVGLFGVMAGATALVRCVVCPILTTLVGLHP